jgi:hypothetical protein
MARKEGDMNLDNAWEMPSERLATRFAQVCARDGFPTGSFEVERDVGRHNEAHYLRGVIVARMEGKGGNLPFHKGDKVVLRNRVSTSIWISSSWFRIQYEPEVHRNASDPIACVIPREALTVLRVHYRKGEFFLEFHLPKVHSSASVLFPASDFVGAVAADTPVVA